MDDVFSALNRLEVATLREKVVISRHWNNPAITVTVNADQIVIASDITAFIEALAAEIARPALILSRKRMVTQLHAACAAALEKIKESTAQVM